jgi:hypothetical protein
MTNEDDMKPEYDFSRGERGKHYVPDAVFRVPVYLEQDVTGYLSERAEVKGVTVSQLVNEILRRDIELIESLK